MPCTPLKGGGFVCTESSYMKAEISYWQNHLDEYKKVFIEYMDRASKCGVENAKLECEAHIENVGVDGLETPEYDADECMSYWDGE